MNKLLFVPFFLFLGLLTQFAQANDGPLSSKLVVERVSVNEKGEEALVHADIAKPGDILQYRMIYENTGSSSLSKLVVLGVIPAGTNYLPHSAQTKVDAIFEVSINGGKDWGIPPLYQDVKQADGSVKKEPVPEEKYSHLRWKLKGSLQAGQQNSFIYRVKVNP